MISVVQAKCHVFWYFNAECHYAEWHYAECPYAERPYAECPYAECPYAECHYAECRYAQCRGASQNTWAQCYKTFYVRNLRKFVIN